MLPSSFAKSAPYVDLKRLSKDVVRPLGVRGGVVIGVVPSV